MEVSQGLEKSLLITEQMKLSEAVKLLLDETFATGDWNAFFKHVKECADEHLQDIVEHASGFVDRLPCPDTRCELLQILISLSDEKPELNDLRLTLTSKFNLMKVGLGKTEVLKEQETKSCDHKKRKEKVLTTGQETMTLGERCGACVVRRKSAFICATKCTYNHLFPKHSDAWKYFAFGHVVNIGEATKVLEESKIPIDEAVVDVLPTLLEKLDSKQKKAFDEQTAKDPAYKQFVEKKARSDDLNFMELLNKGKGMKKKAARCPSKGKNVAAATSQASFEGDPYDAVQRDIDKQLGKYKTIQSEILEIETEIQELQDRLKTKKEESKESLLVYETAVDRASKFVTNRDVVQEERDG